MPALLLQCETERAKVMSNRLIADMFGLQIHANDRNVITVTAEDGTIVTIVAGRFGGGINISASRLSVDAGYQTVIPRTTDDGKVYGMRVNRGNSYAYRQTQYPTHSPQD